MVSNIFNLNRKFLIFSNKIQYFEKIRIIQKISNIFDKNTKLNSQNNKSRQFPSDSIKFYNILIKKQKNEMLKEMIKHISKKIFELFQTKF